MALSVPGQRTCLQGVMRLGECEALKALQFGLLSERLHAEESKRGFCQEPHSVRTQMRPCFTPEG